MPYNYIDKKDVLVLEKWTVPWTNSLSFSWRKELDLAGTLQRVLFLVQKII
jgi:hypothetical protein